jgi:hypothetical protein
VHGCLSVVCAVCVVRQRSLRRADHSSKGNPTDCGASLYVIKKPRERGGHRSLWAAEPEIIIIIIIIEFIIIINYCVEILMECS